MSAVTHAGLVRDGPGECASVHVRSPRVRVHRETSALGSTWGSLLPPPAVLGCPRWAILTALALEGEITPMLPSRNGVQPGPVMQLLGAAGAEARPPGWVCILPHTRSSWWLLLPGHSAGWSNVTPSGPPWQI